jgi:hypothetical protein
VDILTTDFIDFEDLILQRYIAVFEDKNRFFNTENVATRPQKLSNSVVELIWGRKR